MIFFIDAHGFSVLALILSKEEKKREKKTRMKEHTNKKEKAVEKKCVE